MRTDYLSVRIYFLNSRHAAEMGPGESESNGGGGAPHKVLMLENESEKIIRSGGFNFK